MRITSRGEVLSIQGATTPSGVAGSVPEEAQATFSPTLSELSRPTLIEAAASGLPVVTIRNACAAGTSSVVCAESVVTVR